MHRRIGIVILVMSLSGFALSGASIDTGSPAAPAPDPGCRTDRCIPTLDELERKPPPEPGTKAAPPEALGKPSSSCVYRPPRGLP